MDIRKMKWVSALLAAVCIGAFEFIRHRFLYVIPMDLGNVLVAVLTGVLVFLYLHGTFALLENLYGKLQKKKEETAVLQERYRIARKLHDSVAQALFFMNIKINEMEKALRQQRVPWPEIEEMKEAIRLTDTEIRQHIFVLQKDHQEDEVINLPEVIRDYLAGYQQDNGIKVDLSVSDRVNDSLAPHVKNKLFCILQEVLQNIRKHAAAQHVGVELQQSDGQIFMIVQDNGRGIPAGSIKKNNLSFGMKMLKNDVQSIGGRLKLESSPGQGTTVTVSLRKKGGRDYDN